MKNPGCLILLALIFFLTSCNTDRNESNSKYASAIAESARLVDSLQHAQKIPGLDVAVYLDGEIVWSQGFGFADLEHQVPVKAGETRFRIGSVSKPLTSAAIGKLMDAGKVDLDSSVQYYVPYFPKKKYKLTVRQVGGHVGGVRHYRGNEFLMNKPYSSVKSALAIFKDDTLLFEPQTKYSYSSYGFNLISAVVEGASGESFLPYIQREVFNALGMSNTSHDKNDSIIVNRTSFYETDSLGNVVNAPYVNNSYKWAGGGFISTTADLIKFGKAHMNPGFLSEKTLDELTTSLVLTNGDTTHYGFGWDTRTVNGEKYMAHSGGSVGGITQFRIFKESGLILVMLSNSSNTQYGRLPVRITNLFLKARE